MRKTFHVGSVARLVCLSSRHLIVRLHSLLASVQHRNGNFIFRLNELRISVLEEFQQGTSSGDFKHRELRKLITPFSSFHEGNCLRLQGRTLALGVKHTL